MSKERLQKIKVKVAEIDTNFVVGNHKEAYQGLYELEGQYHIDWLIQQAEEKIQLEDRVKELENQLEVTGNELSLVSEESQSYIQALEEIRNARYEYFLDEYAYAVEKIVSQALQGGNENE